MKTLSFDNRNYLIKSESDDLREDDFLRVAFLRAMNPSTNLADVQSLRLSLFSVACNLPVRYYSQISPEQWVDILKEVDWLLSPIEFTVNPFPYFHFKGKKYLGPIGRMLTSDMSEFMSADDAFLDFHNNQNPNAAWLLLAILWRPVRQDVQEFRNNPKEYNQDERELFNAHYSEIIAQKMKRKLHFKYAAAAIFYYESVRQFSLINNKLYAPLFTGSGKPSHMGWLDTALAQSGKKFGDFNSTVRTNWMLLLADLANELRTAENNNK